MVTFTVEELELMYSQIGARSDHFNNLLVDAAARKDVKRIIEIMKVKESFDSILEKILKLKSPGLKQDGFRNSSSGVNRQ